MKSDITLLADIFNNFRKIIFDNLGLDPVKYISAPSLTKDCALKYSKCKIENIKYVSIFQFIRKSVMGGLSDSINPYVKLDNENESIVYNDISSQYPYELSKKLPVSNYKFVEKFDENKYGQDKDYDCILLCDVKTTDEIRKDCLYSQCPMLVSKCKITDKNLSEYQLNQIKNKRDDKNSNYKSQSEKLIVNIGNDSNTYLNFEMYKMFKNAGYNIEIKVLEFKQDAIFKKYIEFLYSKKKQYALQKKKSMELCFKIMMNSFYGSTLTDKTRFKDIKICTTKKQALKLTKKPNFNSFNIINENLVIIELNKNKCVFDSPILIGSQILFNSKCNLYNCMYNIIPGLFGRENITFSLRDIDSIIYKIKNCSYKKYLEILKNNKNFFDKELGLMENEIDENIKEIISLRSKCYSILTNNNIHKSKAKSISKNYCKKNHTHEYFKKVLNNNENNNKAEFYRISLKNGKLQTILQLKDDINNFNDKRHMINNLISKPHEINL